jgi:hypothetical protein
LRQSWRCRCRCGNPLGTRGTPEWAAGLGKLHLVTLRARHAPRAVVDCAVAALRVLAILTETRVDLARGVFESPAIIATSTDCPVDFRAELALRSNPVLAGASVGLAIVLVPVIAK